MEDKILALIETKSWKQLTPAEREMVLSQMTEDAYTEQHLFIAQSQSMFDEESAFIAPDPAILSSLQQHTKKPAVMPWWIALFQYKMPAYQSGLALAAIAVFVWVFWPEPITQFIEKEVLVYENVRDTIEVEVIKKVPVERIVTVVKEVPIRVPTQETEYVEISDGITPEAEPLQLDAVAQNFSNTSLSNEKLSQFLVGVN
ncbi:MAG: hypothetical protein NWS53_00655 [Salibacteraceae bacterium]|nr:hypothetical protein [Salibacteraceae bacterium]